VAELIPNPAWVDRVLKKHWGAIERRVGKKMMPATEPEPARRFTDEEHLALLQAERWGDLEQQRAVVAGVPTKETPIELGTGSYGTVFPTKRKGVVMKITSDPSEARFVVAALSLEEWPEGIVRYYDIIRLPEQFRGRPVYAVWREQAVETGTLIPGEREWVFVAGGSVHQLEDEYLRRVENEFDDYLDLFREGSHYVRQALRRRKDPCETVRKARAMAPRLYDHAAEITSRPRWSTEIFGRFKGVHRIALSLEVCRISAELMEHTSMAEHVGGALSFYLGHEILLADVHRNNIGWVKREDYDALITVITDPGHAVFLTERFEPLFQGIEDPAKLRRKVNRMNKPKPNPRSKRALFRRLMRI
jgi:hypothetical protein